MPSDPISIWIATAAIFYGGAFLCILREIMASRTSQGSIAWISTLVMIPFVAVPLYLIFGLKAFDGYVAAQERINRLTDWDEELERSITDHASTTAWPVLTTVSAMPFLAGNDVELLIDGDAFLDSLVSGITRAKRTVFAQFYIIRDDAAGQRLVEALVQRAQAGVAVYLVYDDIGSLALSSSFVKHLRDHGVRVAGFNERHGYLRMFGPTRMQYRNHRKNVVVDSFEAWVGGNNIGIEYLGKDPRFGAWRDTHIHLRGPAAIACASVFREDWHWATREILPMPMPVDVKPEGSQSVLVMATGPADPIESCAIAFNDVISQARKRLWIVSPYFVPDIDLQMALYTAALRGVDVRILLPEKADHLLVWLASNAHAHAMVKHGIKVYRHVAGFLHQKAILVDDKIAGVGTVNFDNRSFNINFELTLWLTDGPAVGDVAAMLKTDFSNSRQTEFEELAQISLARRLLHQTAKLLSPVL